MQITLYDKDGNPVAYLDSEDQDTIYLWNGNPVCYLYGDMIFGFNGQHLGWYSDGIVWDLDGYRTGFIREKCPSLTKLPPLKSLKQLKPLKSLRELPRYKPLFKFANSSIYLLQFLIKGAY